MSEAKTKKKGSERAEIGFVGGQVAAVRMTPKQMTDVRKALDGGEGWHDLETEDGTLAVDLAKVAFIRVASSDQRIGFSDS